MGVAKAVGDFLRIEKCLPLEQTEEAKLASILVNEFNEQSIKIMKDSVINKKRKEKLEKVIELHSVKRCWKQISRCDANQQKYSMSFFMYCRYASRDRHLTGIRNEGI